MQEPMVSSHERSLLSSKAKNRMCGETFLLLWQHYLAQRKQFGLIPVKLSWFGFLVMTASQQVSISSADSIKTFSLAAPLIDSLSAWDIQ